MSPVSHGEIHVDPDGGPVEIDCSCGRHAVFDPADPGRILSRGKFRCGLCSTRLHIRGLASFVMDHGRTSGVCARCDMIRKAVVGEAGG